VKHVFPFEDIGPHLELVPLAARRALDHAGFKLSLEGWRSLSLEQREQVLLAGCASVVDVATVAKIVRHAEPAPTAIPPSPDPSVMEMPEGLAGATCASGVLDASAWASLTGLQRFVLVHACRRSVSRSDPTILTTALETILLMLEARTAQAPNDPASLSSHLGPKGDVRMIDVALKASTQRRAVAVSRVRMRSETAERLSRGDTPKGEVLATARIAGIMAAKRTPELIPMCHAIALTHVAIEIDVDAASAIVTIKASAEAIDRTGVELEAMVAASIAALTVYDMLKGIDREMVVEDVALLEKSGGRSGHFRRSS